MFTYYFENACVKSYYDTLINMQIMHFITMCFNLFSFSKLLKQFFFEIDKFQKYHEI